MNRLITVMAAFTCLVGAAGCGMAGADDAADFSDAAGSEDVARSATLTLIGRVLDDTGAPVARAMTVLCGNVEGVEVCLQRFSEDNGSFRYDDLLQGYTHLQVMPYAASADSGLLYAGASFVTDLPAPPAFHDWGDVVLPIISNPSVVLVADGGLLELDVLSLSLVPGSVSFPGLEAAGLVGVERLTGDQLPEQFEGTVGYAFYPYDTRLSTAAEVRIPLATLNDVWDGNGPVKVLVNSTDNGGLYAVQAQTEGAEIVFGVTELTWIVLAFE